MNRPLVLGTANRHKVVELSELLAGLPWQVQSVADFPALASPVEDGETFEANALTKARYFCAHLGQACVADDSGLVVDALGGAPGVYSARYAGEGCTDMDNNAKLLRELADVPEARRTARFVCCAAYADPAGREHVERGAVEGRILYEGRGVQGFGYDPLFVPEGYTQTFAEMDRAQKHALSHRGRAFGLLRAYLESLR